MAVALEAFCLMTFCGFVMVVVRQKEESPEGKFSFNQRGILMLDTSRIASYRALRKEKKAMKLPRSTVVWCVLIVCLTLLAFTYLTRKSLCEIRLKDGNREVAAVLAYESGK